MEALNYVCIQEGVDVDLWQVSVVDLMPPRLT